MGVRSIDQLKGDKKRGIEILFDKNIGNDTEPTDEEEDYYRGKLERR